MRKFIVGVTDCSKYDNYAKWITQDPDIEAVLLGYRQNSFMDIERCHGVLLSGGEDVHPAFYNKPEYLPYCYKDDVDEKRDEFELKVIDYTQQKGLPLLGICRGLQIANVFFGGSLIPDIPTFKQSNHSKIDGNDRYHQIHTKANTRLRAITGHEMGEVNSAHHQSVERPAEGFIVSALSTDGIVEGIERQYPDSKPFMLLVQWHPERMADQESVFSRNIRKSFIDTLRATGN